METWAAWEKLSCPKLDPPATCELHRLQEHGDAVYLVMAGGEYYIGGGGGHSAISAPATAKLGNEWKLTDSPYSTMQVFRQDVNGGSFFFFYHSTLSRMPLLFIRKN